jgi:hypothetical protein
MSDFNVVLSDLATLQKNFATEAANYEQLIPAINPPAVDGGDGTINSVLTSVHETFDVLHHSLVASIQHNADGLKTAHDSFERHDIDTRFLYDDLVPKN